MGGMKIGDLTMNELRRALAATERAVGRDSPAARILRRELERREIERRERRAGKAVRDE